MGLRPQNEAVIKMILDSAYLKNNNIISYRIEKQFVSKKNWVYLMNTHNKDLEENKIVLKIYMDKKSLDREYQMYLLLRKKGVSIPKIYYITPQYLVLEYIHGITLCDFFHQQEEKSTDDNLSTAVVNTIQKLGQWLETFYNATRQIDGSYMILRDANLRNLLVGENIYGIDFENCTAGAVEEDIGKICAYALTYTPAFTAWKRKLTTHLFYELSRHLQLSTEKVHHEFEKEMVAIYERRKWNHQQIALGKISLY